MKALLSGNMAIAEGAMRAGLTFFAGYPITPASEIMEYLAERLPKRGGVVVQMEDEIASAMAAIGASWAGAKSMTATSGPGFSLMLESISFAVISETPLVFVHVMRAGPSTGIPTKAGQADVFQARWGAHGDYVIPVYAPWGAQEAFDLTIKAFNVSEELRTPAIVLSDAVIAHTWEPVELEKEVAIVERRVGPEGEMGALVSPMPVFGRGLRGIVESLIHDERGYYAQDPSTFRHFITRLRDKVLARLGEIYEHEAYWIDGADVVLVSYGSTARAAFVAARKLREKGVRAGFLRLKTLWPLDEQAMEKALGGASKVFVVENNIGKVYLDVRRAARHADVVSVPLLTTEAPSPSEVLASVRGLL